MKLLRIVIIDACVLVYTYKYKYKYALLVKVIITSELIRLNYYLHLFLLTTLLVVVAHGLEILDLLIDNDVII